MVKLYICGAFVVQSWRDDWGPLEFDGVTRAIHRYYWLRVPCKDIKSKYRNKSVKGWRIGTHYWAVLLWHIMVTIWYLSAKQMTVEMTEFRVDEKLTDFDHADFNVTLRVEKNWTQFDKNLKLILSQKYVCKSLMWFQLWISDVHWWSKCHQHISYFFFRSKIDSISTLILELGKKWTKIRPKFNVEFELKMSRLLKRFQ